MKAVQRTRYLKNLSTKNNTLMKLFWYLLLVLSVLYSYTTGEDQDRSQPTCGDLVYCQGRLLDTVQRARIYKDSKTFVDMKMKHPPEKVLKNFDTLWEKNAGNLDRQQIIEFVKANFEEGNELEKWQPKDYNKNPKLLDEIDDLKIREFAKKLVDIWPSLARKVKPEVWKNLQHYSFVPVPNGFVVPGGRFREIYYWDSYWIIKGLLLSDMHETAKGMIENMAYLVDKYGFMPNGGRIYYLNRSQPPLLTMMADAYYEATTDKEFLRKNVKYFDKELQHWLKNRTVTFEKDNVEYTLAQYRVNSGTPRPESYAEDVATMCHHMSDEERSKHCAEIKTGAESGWDFSSRWMFDEQGGNKANLSFIELTRLVPVDLNSYLCKSFNIIAKFYNILGDAEKAQFWSKNACYWREAIQQVLWNEQDGIWYDFDIRLAKPRRYYYPSNLAPLWTECIKKQDQAKLGKRALNYLCKNKILSFPGGIPTSLVKTGQQWDLPNAWPPLQALVVQGLDRSGDPEAQKTAAALAKKWIEAVMNGYSETQSMYEKYDAEVSGQYGGGGEYSVQTGFGWTNGVTLEFIKRYYGTVKQNDDNT